MSAASSVVHPGRPRDRGVDARIRKATWLVAGQRRRPSLSIDNIARRAGAGKTSVYRRFAGVEDLLAWLVDDAVAQRKALPDCGSLQSDLRAARALFAALVDSPSARRAWLSAIDAAASSSSIRRALDAAVAARCDDLAAVFRRAQARAEIGPDVDVVELAALFARLMVAELAVGTSWSCSSEDTDRVVDVVLRIAGVNTTGVRR